MLFSDELARRDIYIDHDISVYLLDDLSFYLLTHNAVRPMVVSCKKGTLLEVLDDAGYNKLMHVQCT